MEYPPQVDVRSESTRVCFAEYRVRGGLARGGRFSIKPRQRPAREEGDIARKAAENSGINFSRLSRTRRTVEVGHVRHARKQAQTGTFLSGGRHKHKLPAGFMRISRTRWRKAACHGHWRVSSARDR